jgi:hypothetical protein
MSDLTQRLREHAALHGEIAKFSDEQAQWERDLLDAADYIDNDEVKGIHSCHDNCQRLECVQRREIERLRRELAEAGKYAHAMSCRLALLRDTLQAMVEYVDADSSDEPHELLADARKVLEATK